MKAKTSKLVKVHFIRLMKGEYLLESIVEYCTNNNISSGSVQGIGAISKPIVGYFDLDAMQYVTNSFEFNAELVNCSGNIAKNKETGEIIAHLHMTIGDPSGKTYGGHVMLKNRISVTGEFIILETEGNNYRTKDDEFQLMLLNL